MTESSSVDKTLIETLRVYYVEQNNFARHHEVIRGVITGVLTTLAAGLTASGVALLAAAANRGVIFSIGLSLFALAGFAWFITRKIFERSMMHHRLSEAYRNLLDALLEKSAKDLLLPTKGNLGYIMEASGKKGRWSLWGEFEKPPGAGIVPSVPSPRAGSDWPVVDMDVLIQCHIPLDPRPIVISRHNEREKIVLKKLKLSFDVPAYSLFNAWAVFFGFFGLIGVLFCVLAMFQDSRPQQQRSESRLLIESVERINERLRALEAQSASKNVSVPSK